MVPFSLQVAVYRLVMLVLKLASKVLRFPQPELFAGPGASLQLCEAIARDRPGKVLIVTDAMLVKIGLLSDIESKLKELGVEYALFDGVLPDPTIALIEDGLKVLQREGCSAILAIGGGSSIDAAKVIAARARNNKSVAKMAGLFRVWRGMLPLYAIPTTAGTGSEVTIAAVVSDPSQQKKFAIMDPKLVPAKAALDGNLMRGLPAPITAATGMDALTHAVEAYISRNATPGTDADAVEATRLIMQNLPKVMADGGDLAARQKMAVASYQAGVAFTRAGVGYVHAISHNFGARYHTPHGLANAIVLPYILEYSKPSCTDRLAELARASGIGQQGQSASQLADAFIARIREMNAQYGVPTRLDALKAEDIPAIAAAALTEAHWTYAVPRYMDRASCEGLIRRMLPQG